MTRIIVLLAISFTSLGASAEECPPAVKKVLAKAYPEGKIGNCRKEAEKGKAHYAAEVTTKAGDKIEIDVEEDGKIVQTEVVVALDAVPQAVLKAFAARYPNATAKKAEKETKANGEISYEITFEHGQGQGQGKKRGEATFTAEGVFVEEE